MKYSSLILFASINSQGVIKREFINPGGEMKFEFHDSKTILGSDYLGFNPGWLTHSRRSGGEPPKGPVPPLPHPYVG